MGLLDTTQLTNGSHTIALVASDINGWTTSVEHEIFVDNQTTGTPDIEVRNVGTLQVLPDGTDLYFGQSVEPGATLSRQLQIRNLGDAPLVLSSPGSFVSGACFSQRGTPPASIPAGGAATFWLDLSCAELGPQTGAVTIVSNDPDESPYDITVHGVVGYPPVHHVDEPDAGDIVSGNTFVYGWALDDLGLDASSLRFSVDGEDVTLDPLVYGILRPGACNANPQVGDPNCDHVGWQGYLDTTQLSDGGHVLRLKTVDPHTIRVVVDIPFVVDNQPPGSMPPRGSIDSPLHNQTVSGTIAVSGWGLDDTGLSAGDLTFRIDGVVTSLEAFTYGLHRFDVCNDNPDIDDPNCPWVGWSGQLHTQDLTDGSHTLSVTFVDDDQQEVVRTVSFSVDNIPTSMPPRGWVRNPGPNASITGTYTVDGWHMDDSGLVAGDIQFEVDGQPVALDGFIYGDNRGDACAANGDMQDPNCPFVGWHGDLETTALANGAHTLTVIATDDVGNQRITNHDFVVDNPPDAGSSPLIWLDSPIQAETFQGDVPMSGWAIDDSGLDASSIEIELGGSPANISSFSYGSSRGDVCSAHPEVGDPNCPNVGWVASIATGNVSDGPRSLTTTAVDLQGNLATFERTVIVDNVNTPGPPSGWLASPASGQVISGQFLVRGWHMDNDGLGASSISFELDGNPIALAGFVYGTNRADICLALTVQDPNCPFIGWEGTLDADALSSGSHELSITATDADGETRITTHSFNVD